MAAIEPVDGPRDGFSGELLRPGQPGYDEARRVFNGMFDRRPAGIARCANAADVAAAVSYARNQGLPTAVRGGGHSVAGLSTVDDGIVIDLVGLKLITVDPQTRTARAGGGVLWSAYDAATQAHGLHTPGGRVTTTGLGGFTLGGGYGWSSSKYGLACDNLRAARGEGYDIDALQLIPAPTHVVLGARRAGLEEVAGVSLHGEIYRVLFHHRRHRHAHRGLCRARRRADRRRPDR
jgi:FAD/FMN-containing dehydrogenase